MILTAVLFVNYQHMIQSFVKNVKWLFFVDLVKINGKIKNMDNLNAQAANHLNHQEFSLEKNHIYQKTFWLFAQILNAHKKINKCYWKIISNIYVMISLKNVPSCVENLLNLMKIVSITI